MILITGGCRSGKSEFAEKLISGSGSRFLYMATAQITDDAMAQRVLKHQQRRSSAWETHEGYADLCEVLKEGSGKYDGILLDSVTTMTTNLLFDFIGEKDWDQFDFSQVDFKAAYDWILEHFRRLVQAVVSAGVPFAAVTDEIGLGVVPQTYLGREFRDILGKINQFLAKSAQDVWLVISGIPVKIKDGGQTFGEADIR